MVGSRVTNKSFYEWFKWDEAATNKFHIFDRQAGTLTTFNTSLKFFYFHTVNAYEQDGKLIIDLCGYDNNKIIDDFYLATLATTGIPDEHKASLRRVTLDLAQSSAAIEDLGINFELPISILAMRARATAMPMVYNQAKDVGCSPTPLRNTAFKSGNRLLGKSSS
jgi:carotenoid cleavage dioxygenase-like enzyme